MAAFAALLCDYSHFVIARINLHLRIVGEHLFREDIAKGVEVDGLVHFSCRVDFSFSAFEIHIISNCCCKCFTRFAGECQYFHELYFIRQFL